MKMSALRILTRRDGERAGDFGEQMLPVPGAERDDAVALLRDAPPNAARGRRRFVAQVDVRQKAAKKFEVSDDFFDARRRENNCPA